MMTIMNELAAAKDAALKRQKLFLKKTSYKIKRFAEGVKDLLKP